VTGIQTLAERYVTLWNERDAALRRSTIEALWTPEGIHVSPSAAVRGFDELDARVLRSHQRWVVEEGFIFRLLPGTAGHHDAVSLGWEMVPAVGGAVESAGRDVLLLNDDGRIHAVYQFVLG